MTHLVVDATYENSVLKPAQPLPLKEHEKVQITVHAPADVEAAVERVRATAGLIPCADLELIERIALDPIEEL